MTNLTLNNKYYKLSRLIHRLHRKIVSAPPSDVSDVPKEQRENILKQERFEKESIRAMLNKLREGLANFTIWSRREVTTPLGRFGMTYDLFVNFCYWDGPIPANPHLDSMSFGECMSKLPKYVGKEDTCKLFQLVNEIVIGLLRVPRKTAKEEDG